jgi:hypothetical protein
LSVNESEGVMVWAAGVFFVANRVPLPSLQTRLCTSQREAEERLQLRVEFIMEEARTFLCSGLQSYCRTPRRMTLRTNLA